MFILLLEYVNNCLICLYFYVLIRNFRRNIWDELKKNPLCLLSSIVIWNLYFFNIFDIRLKLVYLWNLLAIWKLFQSQFFFFSAIILRFSSRVSKELSNKLQTVLRLAKTPVSATKPQQELECFPSNSTRPNYLIYDFEIHFILLIFITKVF